MIENVVKVGVKSYRDVDKLMEMSSNINCHFLPQAYLKNFQLDEAEGFVYAAKRTQFGWSKFVTPVHVGRVCSIKNLFIDFSFAEKDEREQLERFFGQTVENNFYKIIERIKEVPFLIMNKRVFERGELFDIEELENLIKFLSLQIIRSPKWLHAIKENEKNMDPKIKKTVRRLKKGLNQNERDRMEKRLFHAAFLSLVKTSLAGERVHEQVIREFDWCLEINLTNIPFITSDDPVINFDEGYGYLFCPLSKKYGIYIPINNYRRKRIVVRYCDEDTVNALNYFQVKRVYANNYHFSTVIGDKKELIKEYIKRTETDPYIIKDPNIK